MTAKERAKFFAFLRNELAKPDLPQEKRAEIEQTLAQYAQLVEDNPLQEFEPHPCRHCKGHFWPETNPNCPDHSEPQAEVLGAFTPIVAAFAGNRFGKTTVEVVKALIQLVDRQELPESLQAFKRFDPPTYGRIVVPDLTATLLGVLLPTFRQWAPRSQLKGGSFDKAWDKQNRILNFRNGSWVQMMTYEMDLDKFGGAALHFVLYDESPPEDIRKECMMRLVDYGGFEMFALTPLMGIGWLYRQIYKRREAPHITVVQGSIHDNPILDEETKNRALNELAGTDDPNDPERRAREYGEFMHFGGMVYPNGFERNLTAPPQPDYIKDLDDVVVGIDPGLNNAGFVWVAFDDQKAIVFDEVLLQNQEPTEYAEAIKRTNAKWGIKSPLYVIDPAARNRATVNAQSVQAELTRLEIPTIPGKNPVEAGCMQVLRRLQHDMLSVSRECRGLRDEAEEYRREDRPDGHFAVVKENDHRLDALRYALMQRPWYFEHDSPSKRRLGYQHDYSGPFNQEPELEDSPPLGAFA